MECRYTIIFRDIPPPIHNCISCQRFTAILHIQNVAEKDRDKTQGILCIFIKKILAAYEVQQPHIKFPINNDTVTLIIGTCHVYNIVGKPDPAMDVMTFLISFIESRISTMSDTINANLAQDAERYARYHFRCLLELAFCFIVKGCGEEAVALVNKSFGLFQEVHCKPSSLPYSSKFQCTGKRCWVGMAKRFVASFNDDIWPLEETDLRYWSVWLKYRLDDGRVSLGCQHQTNDHLARRRALIEAITHRPRQL